MTKSIRSGLGARIGIAALGVGILTAVGSGAATAAVEDTIDVSVQIEPNAEPGALALTVAGDAAPLTEGEPIGTDRVFTGTLPTVTVTDTRLPETVDPAAFWYVVGSITDFAGDAGQPDIVSADTFGWQPALVDGGTGDGEVAPGDDVAPGEGFGAEDFELLSNVYNSADAAPGSYSANAGLILRTPGTVAPGSYSATLTLSLFEG